MPEGPQMVFLKEAAEQFLGQKVLHADGNAAGVSLPQIQGQVLCSIQTFGKEIFFCFLQAIIRVHLMLFGKWRINETLNRELRLGLAFETGTLNFYACDCRMVDGAIDQLYDWTTDVMHPAFDQEKAFQKLQAKPRQLICDVLLDQHMLAGVGNGIKNEVLYRRLVHPESEVGAIPALVLQKLVLACVQFSFEYLDGLRNNNAKDLWQVYQQKLCHRDGLPLQMERIGKGGRSSYFCNKCQVRYLLEDV